MPAPLQRLSPMNTRLSSLEVAVAIPRHQGRRITSSTTASAGTWPANETPDEKERNPGVYGTRHGNLSFGGVRRLTSDHGLFPPATTLVRFDERERCIFEGWRSRAGRRGRAGPSGRRRSIRSRLAGPSSLFPCFPPSLARSRVGGSSFHIGHMGSCGLSWEPCVRLLGGHWAAVRQTEGLDLSRCRTGGIWVHGGIPYLSPPPLSRTPPLSPIIAPQHPPVPRFPTTPHLATTSLLKPCAVTDPQTPSPVRSWPLTYHSHAEAATFWPSSTCTTQHGAARRQEEHEGKSENRTKRLRPSPLPRARTAVSSPIWVFPSPPELFVNDG